jgi:acyl carrier protein
VSDPLVALFAEVLDVPAAAIDDQSSPDTLRQWDSLAAMTLVQTIEDRFRVRLTTREIMRMRTVGIAREVLRKKGVSGV